MRTPTRITTVPRALQVYVGTYTGPESKGIYQMRLDLALGTLALEKGRTQLRLAATEIPAGQIGDVKAVRLTRLA